MTLLGERSQNNSYGRHIVGLYLYASGAQRQNIAVLSHMGICSSYMKIAGTSARKDKQDSTNSPEEPDTQEGDTTGPGDKDIDDPDWEAEPAEPLDAEAVPPDDTVDPTCTTGGQVNEDDLEAINADEGHGRKGEEIPLIERGAGILRRLSEACRRCVRVVARTDQLGHVYDNINWVLRVAEQVLGRKDSMENGTCATVFPLFGATCDDMKTSTFLDSFNNAPPLTRDHVLLNTSETDLFESMLEHAILRIIVSHGGETFARFKEDLAKMLPSTAESIPLHRTEVYPLRAMNIEEMTIKGNAEVLKTIFEELSYDADSSALTDMVKVVFGDQLSVARLRSVINNRAGHDTFANSFLYAAFAPGLFHYQMAAAHGLLETHWGNPSRGQHDPAALSWHNTVLDRKPFVLSNRPPYRVGRDLIFHSLYARVIHCLEVVTTCEDLDEHAAAVTFPELQKHACEIMSRFVNPGTVSKLRSACTREKLTQIGEDADALMQGDMVFENACLFLCDALVFREFTDTIKAGDSGRVVMVLKVLALSYRGSGRSKYAQELLFLIHNLEHVWPKPLR